MFGFMAGSTISIDGADQIGTLAIYDPETDPLDPDDTLLENHLILDGTDVSPFGRDVPYGPQRP